MPKQQGGGGKGGAKIGRNSVKCQKYLTAMTRIKNKTRKLKKRIRNLLPEIQTKIIGKNKICRTRER